MTILIALAVCLSADAPVPESPQPRDEGGAAIVATVEELVEGRKVARDRTDGELLKLGATPLSLRVYRIVHPTATTNLRLLMNDPRVRKEMMLNEEQRTVWLLLVDELESFDLEFERTAARQPLTAWPWQQACLQRQQKLVEEGVGLPVWQRLRQLSFQFSGVAETVQEDYSRLGMDAAAQQAYQRRVDAWLLPRVAALPKPPVGPASASHLQTFIDFERERQAKGVEFLEPAQRKKWEELCGLPAAYERPFGWANLNLRNRPPPKPGR